MVDNGGIRPLHSLDPFFVVAKMQGSGEGNRGLKREEFERNIAAHRERARENGSCAV